MMNENKFSWTEKIINLFGKKNEDNYYLKKTIKEMLYNLDLKYLKEYF